MQRGNSWLEWLWPTERRQGKRQTALPLAAFYWDGGVPTPRQVRDISPEGMYLLTEQRWYLNTMLTVTLTRSDRSEDDRDRSVQVNARVVRTGTDGVGMEFILSPERKSTSTGDGRYGTVNKRRLIEFLARLQVDTGLSLIFFALRARLTLTREDLQHSLFAGSVIWVGPAAVTENLVPHGALSSV